jgi:hypothetical protein
MKVKELLTQNNWDESDFIRTVQGSLTVNQALAMVPIEEMKFSLIGAFHFCYPVTDGGEEPRRNAMDRFSQACRERFPELWQDSTDQKGQFRISRWAQKSDWLDTAVVLEVADV